jgi:hypothetical protein
LSSAVGTQQTENLATWNGERNVLGGGKIAEPLGQAVRLDDGVGAGQVGDVLGPLRKRRSTAGPTAERIDKRVLETRFRRLDSSSGFVVRNGLLHPIPGALGVAVPINDTDGAPLDNTVDDTVDTERLGQHLAAAAGDVDDAVDPAVDPPSHVGRIALEQQFAFIQQNDVVTAFRLVEIGRRPDDADALAGQFLDHPP